MLPDPYWCRMSPTCLTKSPAPKGWSRRPQVRARAVAGCSFCTTERRWQWQNLYLLRFRKNVYIFGISIANEVFWCVLHLCTLKKIRTQMLTYFCWAAPALSVVWRQRKNTTSAPGLSMMRASAREAIKGWFGYQNMLFKMRYVWILAINVQPTSSAE